MVPSSHSAYLKRRGASMRLVSDVEAFIRKTLQDEALPIRPTAGSVYQKIQASNSPLKRKQKGQLEEAIDSVLERIDVQALPDDEVSEEVSSTEQEIRQAEVDHANIMNRIIVSGYKQAGRKSNPGALKSSGNSSRKRSNDGPGESQPVAKVSKNSSSKDSENVTDENDLVSCDTTLHQIAGIDPILKELDYVLFEPLKGRDEFLEQGFSFPKGILFHGPPGSGKTMLCEAIGAELNVPFLYRSAPSIVSGISGDAEKALRALFKEAIKKAPSVIFLDELDAITPKRDTSQRGMDNRIVAQLLTCMDSLAESKTNGKMVLVLASTNRPDSIDPALRRAGRFEVEIQTTVPSIKSREDILRAICSNIRALSDDIDFAKLAKMTPGYVGADLQSLVNHTGRSWVNRFVQKKYSSNTAEQKRNGWSQGADMFKDSVKIDMQDFERALKMVQPSAKREGFTTIPKTTWNDIGALQDVRSHLQDNLVCAIVQPEKFRALGLPIPPGVLLWGPPGCGKTLIAQAIANEAQVNFISVSGPELLNQFVGESERQVRQLFARARAAQPCIIFFDEFDALVPKRNDTQNESTARVVNQFLVEMDGVVERDGVYLVAATNRRDRIDKAILRAGRLGEHIYVGLPSADARVQILQSILSKARCDPDIAEFIGRDPRCEGFSGADLRQLFLGAGRRTMKRGANIISMLDFVQQLDESSAGGRVKT